jgi:tetratricopeptide (TPR) repeat protein
MKALIAITFSLTVVSSGCLNKNRIEETENFQSPSPVASSTQEKIERCNNDTDKIFYRKYPERLGKPIEAGEKELAQEWQEMRKSIEGCDSSSNSPREDNISKNTVAASSTQEKIERCNNDTDKVFYGKYPEKRGKPIETREKELAQEWQEMRKSIEGCDSSSNSPREDNISKNTVATPSVTTQLDEPSSNHSDDTLISSDFLKKAKEICDEGLKKNNKEEAIKDFNRAIEIAPNYAKAYYLRGLFQDNKDDLLKDLEKASSLHNMAGYSYLKTKQYKQAFLSFEEAIMLNSDIEELYSMDIEKVNAWVERRIDEAKGKRAVAPVTPSSANIFPLTKAESLYSEAVQLLKIGALSEGRKKLENAIVLYEREFLEIRDTSSTPPASSASSSCVTSGSIISCKITGRTITKDTDTRSKSVRAKLNREGLYRARALLKRYPSE